MTRAAVKWRAARRMTLWLVTLCLSLWLPAITHAEPQTLRPRDNALRRDAETYARWHDVLVDEALRRLRFQPALGKLDAAIVKRAADTYAGAWIQHRPSYRFIVCVSGNVEGVSAYLRSTPFADMTEVCSVEWSLRRLEAAQLEAGKVMERLGLPYESGVNVYKNRAELYVLDKAEFDLALRAHPSLRLPEGVVVIEAGGYHEGGAF